MKILKSIFYLYLNRTDHVGDDSINTLRTWLSWVAYAIAFGICVYALFI